MKIFFKIVSILLLNMVTSCSILAQNKWLSEGTLKVGSITYEIRAGRGNQIINITNVDNFQKLKNLDREYKDKSEIIPISAVSVNESELLKIKRDIVGYKLEIGVKFYVNTKNQLFDLSYTLAKGNNITVDQLKKLDKKIRKYAKCRITIPEKYLKNFVPYASRLAIFR